jgi:hypothetical protein
MNLSEEQQRHLGILTPGMAAVFAEGADHAYLVRLENYKRKIAPLTDAALKLRSHLYATVKPFQAIPDIEEYGIPISPLGGSDPAIYHAAGKLLDSEKSKRLWSNILLRLAASPGNVYELVTRIPKDIEAEISYLAPDQREVLMRLVIVRGGAEIMHRRGVHYGWSYEQTEELRLLLARGLMNFLEGYFLATKETDLELQELEMRTIKVVEQASKHFVQFVDGYISLTQRQQGPFMGCVHCRAKCTYRMEVSSLLSQEERKSIYGELLNKTRETEEDRYITASSVAALVTQRWLGEEADSELSSSVREIGYCAVLHALAGEGLDEYHQRLLGDRIKEYLQPSNANC